MKSDVRNCLERYDIMFALYLSDIKINEETIPHFFVLYIVLTETYKS